MLKASLIQAFKEENLLLSVGLLKLLVIIISKLETCAYSLLKGSCRSYCQEVMDLLDGFAYFFRSNGETNSPTCNGEGLGKGITCNDTAPGSLKGSAIGVLMGRKHNVFINFIRYYKRIIFLS